jgi:hypothetical protein
MYLLTFFDEHKQVSSTVLTSTEHAARGVLLRFRKLTKDFDRAGMFIVESTVDRIQVFISSRFYKLCSSNPRLTIRTKTIGFGSNQPSAF